MKPIYFKEPEWVKGISLLSNRQDLIFEVLKALPWLEATDARTEYFMSGAPEADEHIEYTYGAGQNARTYTSKPFSTGVWLMMQHINETYGKNYNVCFLNRYDTDKHQLGWHADDSPSMNMEHDIAVVSYGAEREIWWKTKEFKGLVPPENRQLLENGSLFVMPAGFQKDHLHRIPKNDRTCSTRISLTFRNYIK